eukprot:5533675-Alexandrium_andersonii.AAC.1
MDLGTGFVGFYPTNARGTYYCKFCINHCAGHSPIKEMYSDGATEFRRARSDLLIPGDFSVP